ncbi:MFS transporter [Paenibacillus senegalensis]|uniref:MFS transporter n=1 Tax=Paenibacillus senegalensis TaxID=1465766 RepID=UPI000302F215|nr:MFS transporter [Paenibacillus senegalensis]
MEQGKKWDLVAVASIPLIMTLSNSMLIPILPVMERELGISSVQASLIITAYAGVAIVFIPIAGYLSDRFGRKRIILPSLILAAAGGALSGVGAWFFKESAYPLILSGRLLSGIGAAGASPIVLPLVGDMFRREKDVSTGLGIIETSNTFGKVLSPILGSLLAAFVWFLPFLVIPVFCIIAIAAVSWLVKIPKKKEKKPLELGRFISSLKYTFKREAGWLTAIFVIGGFSMFVIFGFLFYLSSVLETAYHIDGVVKGALLAIPLAALCLSSYLTGKKIGENKVIMKWVTFSGITLLAAAMLYCGLFPAMTISQLFFLMFVSGIGIGIALPSLDALITEGISKEKRGTITSLYSSMRFIGVAAGPPVASVLMSQPSALFYTFACVAAVGSLLALFAIVPGRSKLSALS